MKKLLFSFFTLLSLQLIAQDNVTINDANAERRTLTSNFTSIKVSDGIDLFLTQSNEVSVAVSASDAALLARLKTVVEDGTLKIYFDKQGMVWNNNYKRKLKAYVSYKELTKLSASSGANVMGKSTFKLDNLQVTVTSGALVTADINVARLEVDQNSGAETNLTGKADQLTIDVSSGAVFKGFELLVNECNAKASSGGGIKVNISKELNAKASSGGDIKYKGTAVIKEINVSSGGTVKKA